MESNLPSVMEQELFESAQLGLGRELLLSEAEQVKRFTGAVVARNLARYRGICRALGEGLGVRAICRAFGVSPHTVQAIREREPELVATEKQGLARTCQTAARLSVERYLELLEADKVPVTLLPIAAGIFTDKSLLLAGEATSRVERVEVKITHAEVNAWVESLPTIDCGSIGKVPEAQQIGGGAAKVAELVTAEAVGGQAASGVGGDTVEGAGGGSAAGGGVDLPKDQSA